MNHKELKQQVLTELNTILEMSILEVENANEKTMVELLEMNWKYRVKKSEVSDVLNYNDEHLPENWEIKQEQLTFCFPGRMAYDVVKMVKTGFSDGTEPKHKEKSKKENDKNGIELQAKIKLYRDAYQNETAQYKVWGYLRESWQTITKEEVERKYEKSGDGDLIRLCWKYITNPAEVEGVNVAWQQEPKAKFEPIGSYEVPEYMRTKTCVA